MKLLKIKKIKGAYMNYNGLLVRVVNSKTVNFCAMNSRNISDNSKIYFPKHFTFMKMNLMNIKCFF